MMRVKLCGLRSPHQAQAIAALGFSTFGFICVEKSPRYVTPAEIQLVLDALNSVDNVVDHLMAIGVFANHDLDHIQQVLKATGLTGIQLHGNEPPEFCQQVKQQFPEQLVIKALRLRSSEDLLGAAAYLEAVDVLLLDAFHPEQLGGTGQTLPWHHLQAFCLPIPWWLAGGLTADNLPQALAYLQPDGIDLSSGIELAPGNKDLNQVQRLQTQLKALIGQWQ